MPVWPRPRTARPIRTKGRRQTQNESARKRCRASEAEDDTRGERLKGTAREKMKQGKDKEDRGAEPRRGGGSVWEVKVKMQDGISSLSKAPNAPKSVSTGRQN